MEINLFNLPVRNNNDSNDFKRFIKQMKRAHSAGWIELFPTQGSEVNNNKGLSTFTVFGLPPSAEASTIKYFRNNNIYYLERLDGLGCICSDLGNASYFPFYLSIKH